MLSNISIKKYLDSRDIIIEPWSEEMMGAARISIHFGEKILVPKGDAVVDVVRGITPDYEESQLTTQDPFRLDPGAFILGETLERIGLSEKIGMILDGRSTLARLGLTVVQTAMIVDTGQRPKKMTLEVKNNGPHPILLYPKMKFCHAAFFLLNPPATIRYDTDGKYLSDDSQHPIFKKEIKSDKS